MAAVIRPVSVDHSDFGDCRIALFRSEIRLTESNIVAVHGERILAHERVELVARQIYEPVERSDGSWDRIIRLERFGLSHIGFASLDGVYDVLFDRRDFAFGKRAVKNVNFGGADKRTFALRNDLNTLRRAVRTLIELPREVFDRERVPAARVESIARFVHLRLGKHRIRDLGEELWRNEFGVVAVDNPHSRKVFYAEYVRRFGSERVGFGAVPFSFLHEHSVNHIHSFAFIAFAPISVR